MASIQRIKINPKVEIVDDERSIGNGVIITLKKGWSFDPCQDNRVGGGDDVFEAARHLATATKYSGPYDG